MTRHLDASFISPKYQKNDEFSTAHPYQNLDVCKMSTILMNEEPDNSVIRLDSPNLTQEEILRLREESIMDIQRLKSMNNVDTKVKSQESSTRKKNIDILEVDTSESRSAVGTLSK